MRVGTSTRILRTNSFGFRTIPFGSLDKLPVRGSCALLHSNTRSFAWDSHSVSTEYPFLRSKNDQSVANPADMPGKQSLFEVIEGAVKGMQDEKSAEDKSKYFKGVGKVRENRE